MNTLKAEVTRSPVVRGHESKCRPLSDMKYRYPLIDIGVNLTHKRFAKDLHDIITRAEQLGVYKMIVTGTSLHHSRSALTLTQSYPGVLYFTAGVHPHDAKQWTDNHIKQLEELAVHTHCVAIGECGLDFNRMFSPRQKQMEVFEAQVELACRLQKPLFLHEREAHTELVSILNKFAGNLPPSVVHCFTGSALEASVYIGMGLYIGVTGHVWKTNKGKELRSILQDKAIPLDRLLLETDAPFMYPTISKSVLPSLDNTVKDDKVHMTTVAAFHEHEEFVKVKVKQGRNEPCTMVFVNDMVAACLGAAPAVVAQKTTENAQRVFGLT